MGYRLGLVASVLAGLLVGCSKQASTPKEQDNLRRLAVFYGRYIGQNQGKPPPNEAAFKKFIASVDSQVNVDELFTSPRDQKAYVIQYGAKRAGKPPAGPPGKGGSSQVVVYEQEGVGGKRFVALSLGEVKEVDEAQFRELVPKAK